MSDIHAGFQQTQQPPTSETLFSFLDVADALKPIQQMKQILQAYLAPRPGARLLDVGCGLGHEAQRLARLVGPDGSVVGIDASTAMVTEATRRMHGSDLPIVYQHGDGQALPFADQSFDGCRAERVLMYVAQPDQVIREMARVARSGSHVVVFDFDYGGTLLDGPDDGLAHQVQTLLSASVPHGTVGRRLARYFKQAGLEAVTVQPYPIEISYAMYERIVEPTLVTAHAHAHLSTEAYTTWAAAMAAAEAHGTFFGMFMGMIATGRKP